MDVKTKINQQGAAMVGCLLFLGHEIQSRKSSLTNMDELEGCWFIF